MDRQRQSESWQMSLLVSCEKQVPCGRVIVLGHLVHPHNRRLLLYFKAQLFPLACATWVEIVHLGAAIPRGIATGETNLRTSVEQKS